MRSWSSLLAAAAVATTAGFATSAPLQSSALWIAESNQAGANYGVSTATAGDVNGDGYSDVIVGAFLYDNGNVNEGRAYVYLGSPTGPSGAAAWTAEANQDAAALGASVASAGDVNGDGYDDVIVGAPAFDNGQTDEGRAFLFLGSSSGLSPTPAWIAEGNQPDATFGASVASAGDVNGDGYADVIVAAPSYDGSQVDGGRAFLYLGSADGLSLDPAWFVDGGQAGSGVGMNVAAAGDVDADGYDDVVIGLPSYDNGETDEGRSLLFRGTTGGLMGTASWGFESNAAGSALGASVAPAGDVNGDGYADVLVGAPLDDNGQVDEGSARLFLGSSSGLPASAAWTGEGGSDGAQFGIAVATAGDLTGDGYADVIVGAYQLSNGEMAEGRALVFAGGASGLGTSSAWTAESNQASAGLGRSVATAGDVNGDGWSDVLIGAGGYDNGQDGEGRVFLYAGVAGAVATAPAFSIHGGQVGASEGFRALTVGDVNGDGFSDVMFTARLFDDGNVDEGKVDLFFGSPTGLGALPAWTMESNQDSAEFGTSIGTAGDVNGDGYADAIISSRLYDNPEHDEGKVWVYLGGSSGLSQTAAWSFESNQADAIMHSANTAGDVNGDGYADVVVGAYQYDNGNLDEGKVWLFLGGAGGLSATPVWSAEGNADSANFGFKVASAGDVNGDGYSDILVGAWLFNSGLYRQGKAFLYLGGPSGPGAAPAWTVIGTTPWAQCGIWVGTAGDVNGDGYSDVVVGANRSAEGGNNAGRAYCYLGGPSGLSSTPQWVVTGTTYDFLGTVQTAGDVNGDGYSDVAVGAPMYGNNEFDEGIVRVYLGGAAGLSTVPVWTFESNSADARLGEAVGSAGDVNADGYDDVVFGGDYWRDPILNEGAAFLFYGNAGGGLDKAPRQTRIGSTATLAPLGTSDSPGMFALRAHARTPAGRGRVRLEWQVAPGGGTFAGVATTRGAWDDTGAPEAGDGSAIDMSATVAGLASGSLYRWRARIVSDSPLFPHSPWMWPAAGGATEPDLRTAFIVGIGDPRTLPLRTEEDVRAYPTPFTREVRVEYRSAANTPEDVTVYDATGRRIATLAPQAIDGARHAATWTGLSSDGRPAPPGVYLIRIHHGQRVDERRVVKRGT